MSRWSTTGRTVDVLVMYMYIIPSTGCAYVPNVPTSIVRVLCPVYSTIGTFNATRSTDHQVHTYVPAQFMI